MAKAFARAKSRLSELPDSLRAELCAAMLHDTLDALQGVTARVVIVSDEPGLAGFLAQWGHHGIRTLADPGGDLNAAVRAGDRFLGPTPYPRPRMAVVADLPSLQPEEFLAVAHGVAATPRSFVPDAADTGTTMLGSTRGPLDPHFGAGSASQHRGFGAVPLVGDWPGARHDVDTPADITTAGRLGTGPATHRLLAAAEAALRPQQALGRPQRSAVVETTEGARNDPGPSRCA